MNAKGFESFRRLAFLPVLVSNLYSMYGVLFLDWSVADLFFWFWCEFVLTGITMLISLSCGKHSDPGLPPDRPKLALLLGGFSFLMVLFYASLFTGLAYKGEWKSWDRFPEFLADKKIGLLATIVSYAFYFGNTVRRPNHRPAEPTDIERQYTRRSFVIIGLYLVLMCHHHWTGATRIDLSTTYLKAMGMLLLTLKLVAEFGGFDRFFKRRRKNL